MRKINKSIFAVDRKLLVVTIDHREYITDGLVAVFKHNFEPSFYHQLPAGNISLCLPKTEPVECRFTNVKLNDSLEIIVLNDTNVFINPKYTRYLVKCKCACDSPVTPITVFDGRSNIPQLIVMPIRSEMVIPLLKLIIERDSPK